MDLALEAAPVDTLPGAEYASGVRRFQGIPGIERAPGGRLWAAWYGGGEEEGPENYVMAATSGDDGATWSELVLVIDPPGTVRAFDPCLWVDPRGVLWLFWAQAWDFWDGRGGVWAITTEEADREAPEWSAPRRLCNGVMMNKPVVLSGGEWVLPAAVWPNEPEVLAPEHRFDLGAESGSNVVVSEDQGATWALRGGADVHGRFCDEHMIVERRDGSLWLLARTHYGIGESLSWDGGRTWSDSRPAWIPHVPTARFFVRRLRSGRLLLVKHHPPDGVTRSHLTALLSGDDGRSWIGGLMIDERVGVSYPDGVEAEDGKVYLIYDRNRVTDKEILMATFGEADVAAGRGVSASARFRTLVHQATGGIGG